MKNICYSLIAFILLLGCDQTKTIETEFRPVDDAFYFYAFGDWGRNGKYGQQELARTMAEAAKQVRPEFIISTGDNFYPDGVESIHDPQWKLSYENVYTDESLKCDWYVVPGNHDYRGSIQAEINYTSVSDRWNMPARYFHKDVTTEHGTLIRFLFIDTNPLNDEYYYKNNLQNIVDQDTTKQLLWIDSMLVGNFDWKIVVGHHPLYTGGRRRNQQNYVRSHLEPIFDKHQVDLYLAGHDHDLQHIKPEGHPTHYIISGAGSKLSATGRIAPSLFARSIQGFLSAGITKDSIVCQFISVYGEIIYQTEIIK